MAFYLYVIKGLQNGWIDIQNENDCNLLARPLINHERKRKIEDFWNECQGDMIELLHLFLRVQTPHDLSIFLTDRSLFPLSEERERALDQVAVRCRNDIMRSLGYIEDLVPMLMSIPIWNERMSRQYRNELSSANSPAERQSILNSKTQEILLAEAYPSTRSDLQERLNHVPQSALTACTQRMNALEARGHSSNVVLGRPDRRTLSALTLTSQSISQRPSLAWNEQYTELLRYWEHLLGPLARRIDGMDLSELRRRSVCELKTLTHFFRGLREMPDYGNPNPTIRRRTRQRILEVIQGVANRPFLDATLLDLASRQEACGDETAFTFSQIEILRLLYCVAPGTGIDHLAKIIIGLERLKLLQSWVVTCSIIVRAKERNRDLNPNRRPLLSLLEDDQFSREADRLRAAPEVLEGDMALRLRLRDRLQLPIETQRIRYTNIARSVLGGSITAAAEACGNEVMNLTSSVEQLLPILMQNQLWRTRIERETESEWEILKTTAPLWHYYEFLRDLHDGRSNEEKVECLRYTPIRAYQDQGAGAIRPMQEIVDEVQLAITLAQEKLFSTVTGRILASPTIGLVDGSIPANAVAPARQGLIGNNRFGVFAARVEVSPGQPSHSWVLRL